MKKKLLAKIAEKKEEIKNLVEENKVEEAKAEKENLKELQEKFDLIKDIEDEGLENVQAQVKNGTANVLKETAGNVKNAFVNVVRAGLGRGKASEEDYDIINQMSEGSDPDGGVIVPEDISTSINELRRSEDALETLVNVENVTTEKGSRVYEVNAEQVPFESVDEGTEFPDAETPKLKKIVYEIKKYGGILTMTYELLADSTENILAFMRKWIAKKAKATRNHMILKKLEEMTNGKEKTITDCDGLKKAFNVDLDPAIAIGASVLTNQSGFNWLDTLKDDDGRYIIMPDPTKATPGLLFGKYPIKICSNKTLKVTDDASPIYAGNFKEAITLYDRENLTLDMSSVAADYWKKDLTGLKVRERLDIQIIDEEAVIKLLAGTEEIYTTEDLTAMTIEEIKALATKRGYTITKTAKDDIVAEFLAAQGE